MIMTAEKKDCFQTDDRRLMILEKPNILGIP